LALLEELLPDAFTWWRIADPAWQDPLNPRFAQQRGGRWNPPGSYLTLYLNEDLVTARLNLRRFIAQWPYEPEDLREDTGPILVGALLPRRQTVCDVHSRGGVAAAGLPASYPLDDNGRRVPHARCQPIGARAKLSGLRGVRSRCARSRDGAGRELAWFPLTVRSLARLKQTLRFEDWYWG
jgi:hypothetical protein